MKKLEQQLVGKTIQAAFVVGNILGINFTDGSEAAITIQGDEITIDLLNGNTGDRLEKET